MTNFTDIQTRFKALEWTLDERLRRLLAAAESLAIGYGGITEVAKATGVSRRAIHAGLEELKNHSPAKPVTESSAKPVTGQRVRRPGGGRKQSTESDPNLLDDLERLVDPVTRGDPESPLRWTCKSVRRLAEELKSMGHTTSHRMVADLLHKLKYSLQANNKTLEGKQHPDRNAQFEYINQKVQKHLACGNPAISVDTKKKNWWDSSKMVVKNETRKDNLRRSRIMILWILTLDGWLHTGCMISVRMLAGSVLGLITIRQHLQLQPLGNGGFLREVVCIQMLMGF